MRVLLDDNLPRDLIVEHQHNLGACPFGVVVVRARSNRVQDLRPLLGAIREALARIGPGKIERVGA